MAVATRPALTTRQRFMRDLQRLAGSDVRLLWSPRPTDLTVTIDELGNVITWDGAPAGRISALGRGYIQTFDGAANAGYVADANRFSFGNSLVDNAFSCVAVCNVTDTANYRPLIAKWANGTPDREYAWAINTNDTMLMQTNDESANVRPQVASNAVITQGALQIFGATYIPTTGATAASGMICYAQGAAIAETGAEQVTYVAMENGASVLSLGARQNVAGPTFTSWFQGSIALLLLAGGVIGPAAQVEIYNRCKQFFGSF